MKKLSLILLLLPLMWLSVSWNSYAENQPIYPTCVEVLSDGTMLISGRGTKDIRQYDAGGKLLRSWSFDDPVTSFVIDGDRLYATSTYAAGYITCIDMGRNKVVYSKSVGMGACAIQISGDKKKLYVANRYKGTVCEVDASSGKVLREEAVLREPCAMALSVDGKYLFVNNFLPAQRADVDYVAADVSVIELRGFTKVKDIKLSNGSNAVRGIGVSPDGRYAFVSHNLGRFQVPTSQLQQGWMNTSALSIIDVRKLELVGSALLDEPDRGAPGAWDVVVGKDVVAVAQSGTHDISVIDLKAFEDKIKAYPNPEDMAYDLYFMKGIRRRIPINGNGPRALAIKGDDVHAASFFSDIVSIIDTKNGKVEAVALNPERSSSKEDVGERVFHDATYCYQNWQSCDGCHPGDARMDGMNWDLLNDGIGNPKNCKSLLYSHVTPPCMITGIRANAELAVRAGFIHIQFSNIQEDLAECVDEYLKGLQALPSPYLVDGRLSEKAQRGKEVYESLKCDRCHNGTYYTNLGVYRIGEDIEFEAGWDTPTLREVWRTAPYLFDGRAATMKDVFKEHKHGIYSPVSDKEIDELVEYVNSL